MSKKCVREQRRSSGYAQTSILRCNFSIDSELDLRHGFHAGELVHDLVQYREWAMRNIALKRGYSSSVAAVGRNIRAGIGHNSFWDKLLPSKRSRMYAIAFDLDQEQLNIHYHGNNSNNAYDNIKRVLEKFGFHRQQGSVYFGNETVTPVTCVMAVQAVQKKYPWFGKVVSDIRMLRIEEHNDLLPAVAELELDLD